MRAWKLYQVNDIRIEDTKLREHSTDEVLVDVKAAGICGSDIPRIFRDGAHNMPLVPGHEFAGVVTESDDETAGKRVGVFPLIPCQKCPSCMKMHYEMCQNYNYLGSRCDGAFAEQVVVPKWNLLELPDEVSYEQAAMLEPMAVSVHAIRRMNIDKDANIVVCGLGTIGLLTVMFLKEMGFLNIYVIGNKDSQYDCIIKLGIDGNAFCDTRLENPKEWLYRHTLNCGADVYFECVGKPDTISQAIECMAPLGRVCLVGNPADDIHIDKATYWKILRNQLVLTGTWNSSFYHDESDDWHYVIKCITEGRIHPELLITHKFGLDELSRGLEIMHKKTDEYIKVMCTEG